MVRIGNLFFRCRNVLFPLVFLAALVIGNSRAAPGNPAQDTLLDIFGVLLALSGQALRILTIGYQYIIRGGKNRKVYAERLVQGGVFAHCRNPLYIGNLLIVAGIALIINSYAFYLVFLPFIAFAYQAIVRAEEAFLHAKFGQEYLEYCSRVNRWIPRWTGFKKSISGMRFNWRRVLAKEYNTTFVLIPALIAAEVLGDYRELGEMPLLSQQYIIAGAAFWLVLYLVVRTLKKSGIAKGA